MITCVVCVNKRPIPLFENRFESRKIHLHSWNELPKISKNGEVWLQNIEKFEKYCGQTTMEYFVQRLRHV